MSGADGAGLFAASESTLSAANGVDGLMTELMEQAVEARRQMPPAAQDSMAQAILSLSHGVRLEEIAPEHLPLDYGRLGADRA